MRLRSLSSIALFPLVLAACTGKSASYVPAYEKALAASEARAAEPPPAAVDDFLAVYGSLTRTAELPDRVRAAYAEEFYFNDTLRTLRRREALLEYLVTTGEKLEHMSLDVLSVTRDGHDVYVRWRMTTDFSVVGKEVSARSVGISHLRFDADGQVILHQDFWDNTEGFFRHLPGIGGAIGWVRNRL